MTVTAILLLNNNIWFNRNNNRSTGDSGGQFSFSYYQHETLKFHILTLLFTGYGLDGPGIESRWGEIFRTYPDRPWSPHSLLYNGYRVFLGSKERPGRDADPSPLLVPWSWKNRAIPLFPLWAVRPLQSLSACTRVHITFTVGHERIELYLYSPYGQYGLYRASVPVQGCTLPLPLVMKE